MLWLMTPKTSSVEPGKELWLLGSIDNVYIKEIDKGDAKKVTVGDTDSFNIEVNLCPKNDPYP